MYLALCHLGTHVGAVLSLGAGAVSFTHIVKVRHPDQPATGDDLPRRDSTIDLPLSPGAQRAHATLHSSPHSQLRPKASEPVVSALLTAVFLKEFLPIPVYLSLLPVIGGVGLASLKELRCDSRAPACISRSAPRPTAWPDQVRNSLTP